MYLSIYVFIYVYLLVCLYIHSFMFVPLLIFIYIFIHYLTTYHFYRSIGFIYLHVYLCVYLLINYLFVYFLLYTRAHHAVIIYTRYSTGYDISRFLILTQTLAVISAITVLPSHSVTSYSMLDVQLFLHLSTYLKGITDFLKYINCMYLRQERVPHTEHPFR
jgi:hypothetical protein